ncbi:ABC transporter permease [Roseomonas eburnea]|uniref:ABC transporter permease n=1 Tax=Neoroseomonas eburnea TaxID=1346889 RepID=A0A9X9X841_9PROT|nr:ABC transporter permease [Neoroseomonas eburnea]
MSQSASRPLLIDCARMQLRVIGALIIREMHTRFGRHRLGYLWLFFEPLLLGTMIAVIHQVRGTDGIRSNFEFFAIGYILFFNFRGIVNRASGTIGANRGLLYHRQVTLPDLFYARHLIESIACTGVMVVFVFAAVAMGGEFPDSPVKMLASMGLMFLLAQGLALMIGAATSEWDGLERFVHAMSYLMLPFSGLFFMVDWLPEWMQEIVLWVPTVHIFELLRDGQFGDTYRPVYDLSYVAGWILVPHLLGLAGLRLVRNRLGLE